MRMITAQFSGSPIAVFPYFSYTRAVMATMKKLTAKQRDFLADGFDLPKVEEKVLEFWKTNDIFQKSLEPGRQSSVVGHKSKKTFVFYEGPPYATGKPGIHHVLARVVKDIILRFKTM